MCWCSFRRSILADVLLLNPDAPMALPLSRASRGTAAPAALKRPGGTMGAPLSTPSLPSSSSSSSSLFTSPRAEPPVSAGGRSVAAAGDAVGATALAAVRFAASAPGSAAGRRALLDGCALGGGGARAGAASVGKYELISGAVTDHGLSLEA